MSMSSDLLSVDSAEKLDVVRLRRDFPILGLTVHGRPLVYLDNAATSQKPRSVLEVERHFYEHENSNVHRGVHYLSERATQSYEHARMAVQRFINAGKAEEIVFVRGTTEGVNLVATSFGKRFLKSGDEILISAMEHHSNIVPWQMLSHDLDTVLRIVPITDEGELIFEEYARLLNPRTKLVAVTHVSNALGTVNPVKRMVELAHSNNIPVLVDGAQAAPHLPIDVRDLECDFYVFSGHKLFGPTGVGVLFGKERWLADMPPYQGGGDMIKSVSFEKTTYNDLPYKFEAGTPNIAGGVGLAAAIEYVSRLGWKSVAAYEQELLRYATEGVTSIPGLRVLGTAPEKVGVLSFVMDGIHPHDIGTVLDGEGIAVRTGHHCTQPLMQRLGVPATVRASFAFYNTKEEADALVQGLKKVREVLG